MTERVAPPQTSAATLKRQPWLERLVTLTDDQFKVPGTDIRFGLDPVIGLLFPVVGDNVTGVLAGVVLFVAWKEGAPALLLARMAGNMAVDMLAGSVPIIGDLLDVTYRANRRNLVLLRSFQRERYGVFPLEEDADNISVVTRKTTPSWLLGLVVLTVVALLLALPLTFGFLVARWLLY